MSIPGATLALLGLALVVVATLTPSAGISDYPFFCLWCGDGVVRDTIVNLALFVPLGAGLGISRVGLLRGAIVIAVVTTGVEAAQIDLIRGRDAALRDLLMNLAGGVAGVWLGGLALGLTAQDTRAATRTAFGLAALFWASQLLTVWLLQPATPPAPWDVSVVPHPADRAIFFGEREAVWMGGDTLPLRNMRAPRSVLRDGEVLGARFVPNEETHGLASVVRLVGSNGYEVAVVAQIGRDVLLRAHRRGSALGFYTPVVTAPAFAGAPGADTVTVEAWREGAAIHIRSTAGGATASGTLRPSASWMWSLLLPVPRQNYAALSRMIAAIWLTLLFGVLGFVLAGIGGVGRVAAAGLGVGAVGLLLIPLLGGLSFSVLFEWVPAAIGAALGTATASFLRSRRKPESAST